jgi:hypothetical protein
MKEVGVNAIFHQRVKDDEGRIVLLLLLLLLDDTDVERQDKEMTGREKKNYNNNNNNNKYVPGGEFGRVKIGDGWKYIYMSDMEGRQGNKAWGNIFNSGFLVCGLDNIKLNQFFSLKDI